MKKTLAYFSLFILGSSFCLAQNKQPAVKIDTNKNLFDTLYYLSGQKIVVKVLSLGGKVTITDSSKKVYYIYKEYVASIHFANGEITVINKPYPAKDSVKSFIIKNMNNKFNVAVSVGLAIPPDDLRFSNNQYGGSGFLFAETGFHYDMSAQYTVANGAGFMVFIGGNVNSFNVNAFDDAYYGSPYYLLTTKVEDYFTGEYLAGFTFQVLLSKTLFLNMNPLLGIVSYNPPFIPFGYTGIGIESATGSYEIAFAWKANIDLKIMYSKHCNVLFNISILNSQIPNLYSPGYPITLWLLTPTLGVNYAF